MNPIKYLNNHPKLSWTLTIIAIITIFVMSSITFNFSGAGTPGSKPFISLSTLYHFLAFFFLALFLTISITKGKLNFKLFTICFLLVVVYAFTDEIHQFFVMGRWMDVKDVRIDILGIGAAQLIYALHIRNSLLKSSGKDL